MSYGEFSRGDRFHGNAFDHSRDVHCRYVQRLVYINSGHAGVAKTGELAVKTRVYLPYSVETQCVIDRKMDDRDTASFEPNLHIGGPESGRELR